jgi:hypothetical protein
MSCASVVVLTFAKDGGFAVNPEGGYTTHTGHEVPHDEMNKSWYDIRGDKKKELLVSPHGL